MDEREVYKRKLTEALRMNDTLTREKIKEEITSQFSAGEFFGLECEVLEDLGQSKDF